jgi:transcriptional regulator with XRE-family HTH domain
MPRTLGEHLKKRRRKLGLLQREAAAQMGILTETFADWENGKAEPVAAQFRPVMEFLGCDPTPAPKTLAERVEAKRRALGITFEQAAKYLGWDPRSSTRYLNGTWALSPTRADELKSLLALDGKAAETIPRTPRRPCH